MSSLRSLWRSRSSPAVVVTSAWLVVVVIAAGCGGARAPARRAPPPADAPIVLRDWPIGLRASDTVGDDAEDDPAVAEPAPASGLADLDAGVAEVAAPVAKVDGGAAAPAAPSCEVAIAHVVELAQQEGGDAPGELRDQLARMLAALQQTVLEHCLADDWPPDVRRCLLAATTNEEVEICQQQLTPEQRQRVTDAVGANGGVGLD